MSLTSPIGKLQTLGAGILTLGMAATVGGALGFQHLGGYIPCMLCLEQRTPYYIGIPIALLALASMALKATPAAVTRGLLLVVALLMSWSIYLSGFHAGVEWGWWPGPTDCGMVAAPQLGGSLLDQLNAAIPPSCDQAAGRFLGLSFAGWNFVASVALAAVAYVIALRKA